MTNMPMTNSTVDTYGNKKNHFNFDSFCRVLNMKFIVFISNFRFSIQISDNWPSGRWKKLHLKSIH
jgi:hypothetical protein